MAFSRVYTLQPYLLKGTLVTVETDISRGLNAFSVVGLADKAVDESKDRVGSALKNSGFESPKSKNQKTVVSLSPADMKKEGPYFDVAIALGYLLSAEEIKFDPEGKAFLGELGLDGEVKPIKGVLPLVQEAKRKGIKELYIPADNTDEAGLVRGIDIFPIRTLRELIEHINEKHSVKKEGEQEVRRKLSPIPETVITHAEEIRDRTVDMNDIRGQEAAKRGLEIAAAGGHNIAMSGPPGTGKTMLARAFRDILPELELEDMLEITGIHSIAGILVDGVVTEPPFRSPHHTSSYVSLIGGGAVPKPGEVTLAHRGVLFLDEFPEFEKRVIEALRQPLEDNVVHISRAKGTAAFPSNFILIAAMNPCPCGNRGSKQKECICKPNDLARYERKLSGPIMDRIDLWVTVGAVEYEKLDGEKGTGEESIVIKDRVAKARKVQKERLKQSTRNISLNSEMNVKDLNSLVKLAPEVKTLLNQTAAKLELSARAYHRVIKLARTIADLDGKSDIEANHIFEALQYRPKQVAH